MNPRLRRDALRRDALQCVSTTTIITETEKFKNKYRVPPARLKNYDYGQNGAYFVTICTKNREHFFGEIVEGEMRMSTMGEIAYNEWINTTTIRKNVLLGEFVVMPNHFHAVVIIDSDVETHCNASLQGNASPRNASLPSYKTYQNKFGSQSNNLSAIIRGFKGATTKQIHISGFSDFAWQTRFHDRIIRNENEFNCISEYILSNAKNWEKDELFLKKI